MLEIMSTSVHVKLVIQENSVTNVSFKLYKLKCFCLNNVYLVITMCNPNPCKNDGICQDHDGDYICTCPPCSSGKNCEVNCEL